MQMPPRAATIRLSMAMENGGEYARSSWARCSAVAPKVIAVVATSIGYSVRAQDDTTQDSRIQRGFEIAVCDQQVGEQVADLGEELIEPRRRLGVGRVAGR